MENTVLILLGVGLGEIFTAWYAFHAANFSVYIFLTFPWAGFYDNGVNIIRFECDERGLLPDRATASFRSCA
jgi:hypothetical protein